MPTKRNISCIRVPNIMTHFIKHIKINPNSLVKRFYTFIKYKGSQYPLSGEISRRNGQYPQ